MYMTLMVMMMISNNHTIKTKKQHKEQTRLPLVHVFALRQVNEQWLNITLSVALVSCQAQSFCQLSAHQLVFVMHLELFCIVLMRLAQTKVLAQVLPILLRQPAILLELSEVIGNLLINRLTTRP